jgi:hypothetical protein
MARSRSRFDWTHAFNPFAGTWKSTTIGPLTPAGATWMCATVTGAMSCTRMSKQTTPL